MTDLPTGQPTGPDAPRRRGRRRNKNFIPGQTGNGPKTEPGPLTTNGVSGPASHARATETAAKVARDQRIFDLFVHQSLTMEQIAAQVGISNATVCRVIHKVVAKRDAMIPLVAEKWRRIELERAEQRDRALKPHLYAAKPEQVFKANSELVKNADMRAKLTGAYAKPEDETWTGEQVVGLVRGIVGALMDKFAEAEHRLAIAAVLREQAPRFSAKVIDVTAQSPVSRLTEKPASEEAERE